MLYYAIPVVLFVLLVIILLFRISARKEPLVKKGITHHCPLCGSGLRRGERVISEAYSYKNEKIMHIRGCVLCTKSLSGLKRICPVCKKILSGQDYLVGKMWEEPGKKRLHVAGCNGCLKYN